MGVPTACGAPASPLLVRVQHHPGRSALLGRLLPAFAPLPVEVVVDPEPDGRPSAWRTYRECLTRPHDAEWIVVVQDDAILAEGFAGALPTILAANPGKLVCLFVSGAPSGWDLAVAKAWQEGHRYATPARPPRWTPTVATAWPVERARPFVDFTDRRLNGAHHVGDDNLLGRWVKDTKQAAVATVPCVVQHPDDSPSLIGRKARPGRQGNRMRTAVVFTGTADYDWSDPNGRG